MKKIKAYAIGACTSPSLPSDTALIFVPSGFKGEWIAVYEDSAYNVNATYATDEQKEVIRRWIKRRRE